MRPRNRFRPRRVGRFAGRPFRHRPLRSIARVKAQKRRPRQGAKLPGAEEMQELLAPKPGEELTRSQQVALLRSGVDNWNHWYTEEQKYADLDYADLQGMDLQDVVLLGASLQFANLVGTNLVGANLSYADLTLADLQGANMHSAELLAANMQGADLEGANMHNVGLRGADLHNANLQGVDLQGADLQDADLQDAYYNSTTVFPEGFDPTTKGMKMSRRAAINPVGKEMTALQAALDRGDIDSEEFEVRMEELEARSRHSRPVRRASGEAEAFVVGEWVIIDDLYSGPIISAEPDPDFPDIQAIQIRISADKELGYWAGENQHTSGWFRVDLHDIKWVGSSQRDDDYRYANLERNNHRATNRTAAIEAADVILLQNAIKQLGRARDHDTAVRMLRDIVDASTEMLQELGG